MSTCGHSDDVLRDKYSAVTRSGKYEELDSSTVKSVHCGAVSGGTWNNGQETMVICPIGPELRGHSLLLLSDVSFKVNPLISWPRTGGNGDEQRKNRRYEKGS